MSLWKRITSQAARWTVLALIMGVPFVAGCHGWDHHDHDDHWHDHDHDHDWDHHDDHY